MDDTLATMAGASVGGAPAAGTGASVGGVQTTGTGASVGDVSTARTGASEVCTAGTRIPGTCKLGRSGTGGSGGSQTGR